MKAAALGILLLAHGGNPEWNAEARRIAQALGQTAPTELALGMADPAALQAALDALQRRGARRVVAVPLFINSRSEVMDHTRYVLGLKDEPSAVLKEALAGRRDSRHGPAGAHHGHGGSGKESAHMHHAYSEARVKTELPIALSAAFDDHPLIARIALERALGLSRDAGSETVFLIGHGPVDEPANDAWLETMRRVAAFVREKGGFSAVEAGTIRDDSAPAVRAAAIAGLRARVARALRDGRRVIVVPYLIARGGIESHVQEAVSGLDVAWDGRTLCPHPEVARWARARVDETLRKEDAR